MPADTGLPKSIPQTLRVTLVGGSGFIGTKLAQLMSDGGIDFEIVDLYPSGRFQRHYKYGDVRDHSSLESAITGTVVINLAAVHKDDISDISEYHRTNIDGMNNLVSVCEAKGITKIIFTSSVAVYGFAKPGTDESGDVEPANEYGKSKFKAEQVLSQWCASSVSNKAIILRPTVVFGEGNRGNVYNLCAQIASKKFLMIGRGLNPKSMAYVANVAEFIRTCIFADIKYEVINYVDAPDFTMSTLVRLIRRQLLNRDDVGYRVPYLAALIIGHIADFVSVLVRRRFPISAMRVRKFCAVTSFASASELRRGFKPKFTLEEALERTLLYEFAPINRDNA